MQLKDFMNLSLQKRSSEEHLDLELSSGELGNLEEDEWTAFCNALAQYTSLVSLSFCEDISNPDLDVFGNLDATRWSELRNTMAQLSSLKSLIFGCCGFLRLDTVGWTALGNTLAQCTSLQHISFDRHAISKLDTDGWAAFGNTLTQCTSLRSLAFGPNLFERLDTASWTTFGNILAQLPSLESLAFYQNSLSHLNLTGWTAFSNALTQCVSLQNLCLSGHEGLYEPTTDSWLDTACWTTFCDVLPQLPSLRSLDLSWNALGALDDARWSSLSRALTQCHSLQSLDLGSNEFRSRRNWPAIHNMLTQCPSLQHINLSNNSLFMSFDAAFDMLPQLPSLRSLDLSGNCLEDLNDAQCSSLSRALTQCHSLQSLNLGSNRFSSRTNWKAFYNILTQCPSLQHINLSNNDLHRLDNATFDVLCSYLDNLENLLRIEVSELTDARQLRVLAIANRHREALIDKVAKADITLQGGDRKNNDEELPSLPLEIRLNVLSRAFPQVNNSRIENICNAVETVLFSRENPKSEPSSSQNTTVDQEGDVSSSPTMRAAQA